MNNALIPFVPSPNAIENVRSNFFTITFQFLKKCHEGLFTLITLKSFV